MVILHMERNATDNVYLHKDFHKALNCALIYLAGRFGESAVREYLRDFAAEYYAPLAEALKIRGLDALKDHFERIYAIEGGDVQIERLQDPDSLTVTVRTCPAVAHIRAAGDALSPLFYLTSETVHETICANTPYQAILSGYEPTTGACVQHFSRRSRP